MRAGEQDRLDVAQRRHHFQIARRFAEIERFVFLDESGARTNMTRLYGRASVGERCHDSAPHGHWRATTMLSAIRSSGVIEAASIVFHGALDATLFRGYVQRCLAPALRPGDVVVMDNLPSHKVAGVAEAIDAAGASVWYLPPYSPDLNPIEKLWSKVKSRLRAARAATIDALIDAVGKALAAVTPHECLRYFRSCGYGDY